VLLLLFMSDDAAVLHPSPLRTLKHRGAEPFVLRLRMLESEPPANVNTFSKMRPADVMPLLPVPAPK